MALGFAKITKEDLKEAGLDTDLLKTLQEKGVTKEELGALKTELTESFKTTLSSTLEEFKGGLKDLLVKPNGGNGGNNNNGNNNNGGNNDGNNNQPVDPDPLEVMSDPMKYIRQEAGKVYGATLIQNKKMQYDFAYEMLSKQLKGFGNSTIKTEIDERLKAYTPEVMARLNTDPAQLIKDIHAIILGNHHDEIVKDTAAKTGKYSMVASSSSGSSSVGANSNGEDKKTPEQILTPEELKQASKFGMTPQQWLDSANSLHIERT